LVNHVATANKNGKRRPHTLVIFGVLIAVFQIVTCRELKNASQIHNFIISIKKTNIILQLLIPKPDNPKTNQ
jgi:hypothetical protein